MKTGTMYRDIRIIRPATSDSKNNVLQQQEKELCQSDTMENNISPSKNKKSESESNKVVSFRWYKKVIRPISGLEVLSGTNTHNIEELNLNQPATKSSAGREKQLEKQRRSTTEAGKTQLSAGEEDSLESMKDRIACFVSYLESDTDSHSDTEFSQLPTECENKLSGQGNKSDEENQTKAPSLNANVDFRESSEGKHLFEKKFKKFTSKWDMKTCPLREGVATRSSHAPVRNEFTKDYDVSSFIDKPHLHEARTRSNVTSINSTISINNLDEGNDKQTLPSLTQNALTAESIGSKWIKANTFGETNFLPSTMKQGIEKNTPFSACEVLAINDKRPEGLQAEGPLNNNQLKESSDHSSPGVSNCSEKTSKEEYGDSKQREMHRIGGSDVEKRPFLVTTNIRISRLNECESSSAVNGEFSTSADLKNSNRTRPVNELTIGQSNTGNVDDKCTTLAKKSYSQTSSKNPTNRGRKLSSYESETTSSCERETVDIHSIERSIVTNSRTYEDRKLDKPESKHQDDKKDRKRSRSISLEKERRSRSSSSERLRSRGSPNWNSRARRKYQNLKRRRRMDSHTKNGSSFRSSWMDNIVVKIADPPRPPRKRKNTTSSCEKSDYPRQRRRIRSPELRNEPSHIRERSSSRDEDRAKKRRWTYDDYERTTDGRLRRKLSFAPERTEIEENPHWKRYDDESTMPYQGYADSQVQSLLRQLCQNYITQLYPLKPAENRAKYKSAQVVAGGNKLKPHRNWYMSLKDWESYEGEPCKKEGSGKTLKTQRVIKTAAANKKQQKSAPKQQSLVSDRTNEVSKDCDMIGTKDNETAFKDDKSSNSQSKKTICKKGVSTDQETATAKKTTTTEDQDIETDHQKYSSSENKNHGEGSNFEDDSGLLIKQKPVDKDEKELAIPQFIKFDKNMKQSDLPVEEKEVKQKKLTEDDEQKRLTYSNPEETSRSVDNEDLNSLSNSDSLKTQKNILTHDLKSNEPEYNFEKFASDTFAICNLTKNVASSPGNMRNDLIVTLTPSSYLYSHKNIKEKSSAQTTYSQDSNNQGIFIPTSSSFAKTTDISCNTLCFHFDFDYYDTTSTATVPDSSVTDKERDGTECAHSLSSFDSSINVNKTTNDDTLLTSQETESSSVKDRNPELPLSSQGSSNKGEPIAETKELNNPLQPVQQSGGSFPCSRATETSTSNTSTTNATSNTNAGNPKSSEPLIPGQKNLTSLPQQNGRHRQQSSPAEKSQLISGTANAIIQSTDTNNNAFILKPPLATPEHESSRGTGPRTTLKSAMHTTLTKVAPLTRSGDVGVAAVIKPTIQSGKHCPEEKKWPRIEKVQSSQPLVDVNKHNDTNGGDYGFHHNGTSEERRINTSMHNGGPHTPQLQDNPLMMECSESYSSVPGGSYSLYNGQSQHPAGYFNQPVNYGNDLNPPNNQSSRFVTTFSNYTRVVINRSMNEQHVEFVPQDEQQCLPNQRFTQLQADYTNQEVNQIHPTAVQHFPPHQRLTPLQHGLTNQQPIQTNSDYQRFTPLQPESANQQLIQMNSDSYQRCTPLQPESTNQQVNQVHSPMKYFPHQQFTPLLQPEPTNHQLLHMNSNTYQRCAPLQSQESSNQSDVQGNGGALPYPYLATHENRPLNSRAENGQFVERRQQHEVQISSFVNNGKQFYEANDFSTLQGQETMKHKNQQQRPYRHYKLHEPQHIQHNQPQQHLQEEQQQLQHHQHQHYHHMQQQLQQQQHEQQQQQQQHQEQHQQQHQQFLQHHYLQDPQRFHKDLSYHPEKYPKPDQTHHELQLQHKKQRVQQQQILGAGHNRSSVAWHSDFLNALPNKVSDMSHIPWGQHALDRRHQFNVLSTNSQQMPLYDKR